MSVSEGKGRWKGKGQQDGNESVWAWRVQLKTFFPLLISTQSVAFSYTDFYTTLYFVNQRNYKTLAMQTHAFTRTRYFYSLNIIISHLTENKEGLGYLSVCAIASRSSPPSHVCICNGHPGSELCCCHCNVYTVWPRIADFVGGRSWMFTSYDRSGRGQRRQGRGCMYSTAEVYGLRHQSARHIFRSVTSEKVETQ
jgi:hypothetical protein